MDFSYLNKIVPCTSGRSRPGRAVEDSRSVDAFNFNGVVLILDEGW